MSASYRVASRQVRGKRVESSRRRVTPAHIKEPRTVEGYIEIFPTITLNEFVNYTSVDSPRNTPEGAAYKLPINKIKAIGKASDVYRLTRFQ